MANPQPGFDFDFHESQPQPARFDLTVPPQPSVGHGPSGSRAGAAWAASSKLPSLEHLASPARVTPRRGRAGVFQMTNPQPGSLRLFHDVHPKARLFSMILPPQSGVGQSPIGSLVRRRGQLAGAQ